MASEPLPVTAQTFVEKGADEQTQAQVIARDFVPAMMDPILGDYARNVPDARRAPRTSPFLPVMRSSRLPCSPDARSRCTQTGQVESLCDI